MSTHWASHAIEQLSIGNVCTVTPHGNSMQPRIQSGATVTLAPVTAPLQVNDAVLVKVHGTVYLHLIKAIRGTGDNMQYQIGSARGSINGWTGKQNVYGIVTHIEQPK